MYKSFFKRLIDFFISLIGLIVLFPVFIVVTIALFVANSGRPFFFQSRPGKDEKIFKIIKFKSMNDKRDSNGNLLSDVERLTKVGRFVRKTSLDEIPQLINVLKGDMSLIGPRPLLIKYLSFYSAAERCRHNVRPGITGWAQINGRNTLSWDDRLKYDIYYVENLSLMLDVKIFWLSIQKVILRQDVVEAPSNLMLDLDEERKHVS